MTDPAKDVAATIDREQRQASQDEERAKTHAARDEYTRDASGPDGKGSYKPDDAATDLGS